MAIDDYELKRFESSSKAAGEYLQELGKTDLSLLSKDEWFELLHVIVYNFDITAPF